MEDYDDDYYVDSVGESHMKSHEDYIDEVEGRLTFWNEKSEIIQYPLIRVYPINFVTPNFSNFNSTDSKTIPLTISNTGTGTGITIHIEDSILNSLIEKVPWNDVFESFNNKLSRTEETKHIKEHIYKVANEDNTFDHQQWNNFKHNLYSLDRQNQNHWVKHIHPTINVAGKNLKTSL